MARTPTSNSHPWRKIIVLLVVLAVAVGGMAMQKLWTPKLGLDLVGGTSILLRADTPGGGAPEPEQMDEAVDIIRNRVADIAEVEVNTQGDRYVLVEVPGAGKEKTREMVGQTAELRFRQVLGAVPNQPAGQQGGQNQGGNQNGGQDQGGEDQNGQNGGDNSGQSDGSSASETEDGSQSDQGSNGDGNKNRAAAGSLAAQDSGGDQNQGGGSQGDGQGSGDKNSDGQDSQDQGEQGAGQQDGNDVPLISKTPASQQQLTKLQKFDCKDSLQQADEAGKPLFTCDQDGQYKYVLGPALVKGTNLTDASAGVPQQSAGWQVQLELDSKGKDQFADATRQMYQLQQPTNQFAIVLDSKVVSAPQINEPIPGGQASISGDFDQKEAQDLAQVLKYGSLPLSFQESEVTQVSPTLGSDQLQLGLIAGGIGMILVLLYAMLYYRALGFIVMFSLVLAAGITYVLAVWLGQGQGFTLTLAGVAGLIVAIGITADSFVVFFERIRDEMREGKTPRAAVEAAWLRARRTILISDAVSLIAALVLYLLSVGNVRSFAYALGLTTVVDVIVVFMFTKPVATLLVRTKFFGRGHPLSGLSASKIGARKRNPYRVSSGQPAIEEH